MIYKDHTIDPVRESSGLSVKISWPLLNSRTGTFATEREAINYAKERVDKAGTNR